MPTNNNLTFDIHRSSELAKTFRVEAVRGKFDIQAEKIEEHFKGEIILPEKWNVGVIVGASGTGKTTIANHLFGERQNYPYKAGVATIENMPENCTIDEITKMFNSVGFSSPPSWLKPYEVLSNGEKMRVDLARALLMATNEIVVFDEFTSVVDRNVAKIGSFAVQKTIRRMDKQFVAVSCHYDILDWLEPDWVFDTDKMEFVDAKKKLSNDQNSQLKYENVTENFGSLLVAITI